MMIFGTYANPWGGGGLRGHKSINLAEILKVNRNLKVREQERERETSVRVMRSATTCSA